MKTKHLIMLALLFATLILPGCSTEANAQVASGDADHQVVETMSYGPEYAAKIGLKNDGWVSTGGYEFENGVTAFEVSYINFLGTVYVRYRFGDPGGMGPYRRIPADNILEVSIEGEEPMYFRIINSKLMIYTGE